MRRFVLILSVVVFASLASPLAASAFAKAETAGTATEATVCVCPPDCTHEMASTEPMDPECAEHKCCKKEAKAAEKADRKADKSDKDDGSERDDD